MTIKFLIADDDEKKRVNLCKNLKRYSDHNNYQFEIVETDSYLASIEAIETSNKKRDFFHILFIDIDFTCDDRDGKEDSGFQIIEKAFEVSPLSRIITIGDNTKSRKNEKILFDLVKKGRIVDDFNKDDYNEDPWTYFQVFMNQTIDEYKRYLILWDIWENHCRIISHLAQSKVYENQENNDSFSEELQSYLNTVLAILISRNRIGAEFILNRSLLQMYHRALEIFCEAEMSEKEIKRLAEKNKGILIKLINKPDLRFTTDDRVSALQKIVAKNHSYIVKFGYKLNWYRNAAMHPKSRYVDNNFAVKKDGGFEITIANVIYASLTLHLYVVPGIKPDINRITEFAKDHRSLKGVNDLRDLLSYISFKMCHPIRKH